MNLHVFLVLIEDNKLDEILPLLHKSKPEDYELDGNDNFAEQSISSAITELRNDHDIDKARIVNRVGYITKWLCLHSAVN